MLNGWLLDADDPMVGALPYRAIIIVLVYLTGFMVSSSLPRDQFTKSARIPLSPSCHLDKDGLTTFHIPPLCSLASGNVICQSLVVDNVHRWRWQRGKRRWSQFSHGCPAVRVRLSRLVPRNNCSLSFSSESTWVPYIPSFV